MNATRLSVLAAAALLAACAPRDMGAADANLATLVDKQLECRTKTQDFTQAYDSPQDAAACESVASGLVSLSRDALAAAREGGIDPRNAVFFYRRAATAAWQSQVRTELDNVAVYASPGLDICGGTDGVQPGDCTLLAVLPALAGHDAAVHDLAALQQADYLRPADAGAGSPAEPAETRLGDVSRRLFEAWRDLRGATGKLCAASVHASLRGYVAAQEQPMVDSLQAIVDRAARTVSSLPVMTAARYDTLCQDVDGTAPDVRLRDASRDVPLESRLHSLAWCQWQRASRIHQASPGLCPGG